MTTDTTDDTLTDLLGEVAITVDPNDTPSYTVSSSPWVTGSTISAWGQNNWSINDSNVAAIIEASGKLSLQGTNADIEINGQSLTQMLRRIEERINILTVNTELESDWDELRELGNQYRALEQRIKNKMETWNKLRASDQINR
jgi:hypothetical protein